MKLYLIRHGQPEIVEYSGFPGPNLSLHGHRQAITISEILCNKEIEIALSSDYTRSIETANPFLDSNPRIQFLRTIELREREKENESHESLKDRVQTWFKDNVGIITNTNSAIFGHCGSLNMILFHIDPNQIIMEYPFEDKFKCLTPIGGIWELEFKNNNFVSGQLIYNGQL